MFINKSINLFDRCRGQDLKMQFPSLILRMRPQKAAPDKELNLCTQTKVSRLLTMPGSSSEERRQYNEGNSC